jgi:hypothetical protein
MLPEMHTWPSKFPRAFSPVAQSFDISFTYAPEGGWLDGTCFENLFGLKMSWC